MAETKTKARTTETAKTIESTFYGRLPGPKTRPRRGSLEAVRAPYSWGRSRSLIFAFNAICIQFTMLGIAGAALGPEASTRSMSLRSVIFEVRHASPDLSAFLSRFNEWVLLTLSFVATLLRRLCHGCDLDVTVATHAAGRPMASERHSRRVERTRRHVVFVSRRHFPDSSISRLYARAATATR